MSEDKNSRYRFTVPTADTSVLQWLDAQSNISFSIRVLIKAFIRDYGMQAATCLEVGFTSKKRGRPPKQVEVHLESMSIADDVGANYADDETENMPFEEVTQDVTQNAAPAAEPVVRPEVSVPVQETPVQPSVPVQPVQKPQTVQQAVAQKVNAEEPSIDDMFNAPSSTAKPVNTQTDDDGFVNPDDLF